MLWIPDSRYWIPDSLLKELGVRIPIVKQGHPMDLFLKISVLYANFCWLGDVEEIIVLGRKVLLGKKIIQGVRGDLKSRIAATGYL